MDRLETLQVFVEIVEKGSLSAVARARGVAPSTVTLALQSLEERVGTRLLRRTTRSLSPTAEGERFLESCRRILRDFDLAMDSVSDTGALSGTMRITATNDFGRGHVAPCLTSFMAKHPGVHVELVLTDAVVDLVEQGFDLGIRMGPPPSTHLQGQLLVRGRRYVCASPRYWRKHGRPQHPRDLARHNCLVLDRPGAPQRSWSFLDGDKPLTVRVDGDRRASDGGVLRDWAVAGAGVVFKSEWDVADDLAARRLSAVLEKFTHEEVDLYAVHPAGRHPARRVSALLVHLSAHLARRGA